MRYIKTAVLMLLLTALVLVGPAYAASSYYEQARVLYNLNLYKGTSATYFEPDLESYVDRETAIVLVLRLFGKTSDVENYYDYRVQSILSAYSDGGDVSSWARKYVAYAINNQLFPGELQGSVLPKRYIDGKTFIGLMLNCMGYKLYGDQWTIAAYINSYLGGVSADDARYVNDKIISKNDMVAIIWESLDMPTKDYATLLNMIVDYNSISSSKLTQLGFIRVNGKLIPPAFYSTGLATATDYSVGYTMSDGSKYAGGTSGGVPDGFGVVTYEDGSVYEGYVSAGKRHGEGKLLRSDGFVYVGGWQNDMMNGKGAMTWANGDRYSGDVVNGSFQGTGTMTWASGNEYTGQWWAGNFHGKGKFKWNNGDYYDGEWNMGVFNGYGTMMRSNGEMYEGYWENGKRHGYGKCILADKTVLIGRWENDEYVGS